VECSSLTVHFAPLCFSAQAFTTYEWLRHHLAFDPSKLSKAPSAG
jgi:hypothetical protein